MSGVKPLLKLVYQHYYWETFWEWCKNEWRYATCSYLLPKQITATAYTDEWTEPIPIHSERDRNRDCMITGVAVKELNYFIASEKKMLIFDKTHNDGRLMVEHATGFDVA